jgi:hypothetical protein
MCGEQTMCAVESVIAQNILLLHSRDSTPCGHRLPFGYRQVCTCPVRFAIATQYGQ